jgi:Phage late control gene D protein (GPD).
MLDSNCDELLNELKSYINKFSIRIMLHPNYRIQTDSTSNENQFDNLVSLLIDLSLDIPSHLFEGYFGRKGESINFVKEDQITVSLGYEEELVDVYKGLIDTIDLRLSEFSVLALSSILKLCNLKLDRFYEKQNAGYIVNDLCKAAGVSTDIVEDGVDLPSYAVDSNKNAYEHIRFLSYSCGFETYTTNEDKFVFKKYKMENEHKLAYGQDIINFKKLDRVELLKAVKVVGESPASIKGADTTHWYTKNMVESVAGNKDKTEISQETVLQNKFVKTTATAADVALANLNRLKSMPLALVKIVGNSGIKLCDTVNIEGCPDKSLNGKFQVRRVRHSFSKQNGFTSILKCRGVSL